MSNPFSDGGPSRVKLVGSLRRFDSCFSESLLVVRSPVGRICLNLPVVNGWKNALFH